MEKIHPLYYHTLGKVITARRKKIGLTQAQMAEAADISTVYYREVEQGVRNPNYSLLILLGKIFKTKYSSIQREIEEEIKNLYGDKY
ncbi:helix-turn-helix domain-containing protein [Evansella tamaricis]|uniref:Helix-turn-helix domain-containing protein n=1 Tax=Evansella tamaricis TaxID=2069301 RepID=A0ABS6JE39_9BACI|nr:helix-turn-helix transcriptional regulator [Evansella tamaricis]MBU9711675.1 helix-turn-helix domain-containing protein [Evansella tamaricis]